MKFLYEYRTSDNEKHSGSISAADKEAAYAALKRQGIKPSRFAEAPGFFNKLFGKGKRWLAIFVLGVSCLVLGFYYFHASNDLSNLSGLSNLDAATRRQVIGDTAIIEKGIRTGWADVFAEEGERFLASFAIPGVPAGQRNTTEEEIEAALSRQIEPTESDGIEARQIKAMVEGMKDELREFLKCGGTITAFGSCLVERQEAELGYYNRTKNELETMKDSGMDAKSLEALWEKRNNELRQMGVKLIPLPE